MRKLLRINIFGKVQEVGFRFKTMEKAYVFGVQGYVRNKRDGSILIEAEGEEENLQGFMDWCKVGPTGAKIDNIQIQELPLKNYTTFEIIRKHSSRK